MTEDGKIMITPKRKMAVISGNPISRNKAKFKGSYKKVDKVVVINMDENNDSRLDQQVLVHQNFIEYSAISHMEQEKLQIVADFV